MSRGVDWRRRPAGSRLAARGCRSQPRAGRSLHPVCGHARSRVTLPDTVPPPLPEPYEDPAEPLTLDTGWVTLVGCGAAAAIGVAGSAQVYLSMLGHGHHFLRILAWHVSSWLFWGLAASIVLRVGSGLSIAGGRSGHGRRAVAIGGGLASCTCSSPRS